MNLEGARFTPSRHYWTAGLVAAALTAFSLWCGFRWWPAFLPAALFALTAGTLLFFAFRPAIEITPTHLHIGAEAISWDSIRRVDRTGWVSPLLVYLTLNGDRRVPLVFPGSLDDANSLLRLLMRGAREALIDGLPYRQFWGESVPAPAASVPAQRKPASRVRMLLAEDEEEVIRLFQQLKTVGHLDPKKTTEEK